VQALDLGLILIIFLLCFVINEKRWDHKRGAIVQSIILYIF
jgi:hypothetical protein